MASSLPRHFHVPVSSLSFQCLLLCLKVSKEHITLTLAGEYPNPVGRGDGTPAQVAVRGINGSIQKHEAQELLGWFFVAPWGLPSQLMVGGAVGASREEGGGCHRGARLALTGGSLSHSAASFVQNWPLGSAVMPLGHSLRGGPVERSFVWLAPPPDRCYSRAVR